MTPRHSRPGRQSWRPGRLTYFAAFLALFGLVAVLYPSTAAWLSSLNQSRIIAQIPPSTEINPSAAEQLTLAREYNAALTAGVKLEANANVPVGTGTSRSTLDYTDLLDAGRDGLMGRIRIPSIDVDLPIYHGTSEETLLRGAGHLEGTHLPTGGVSTRSVITAHRGLANSTMFTNLDKVTEGDRFTVEVLGEAYTYEVFNIDVVLPQDTGSLRTVPGEDLLTLITCTPLGINSHRIVVTGERVTPTPIYDVDNVGRTSDLPGFPRWALWGGAGLTLISAYVFHRGFVDSRVRERASLVA